MKSARFDWARWRFEYVSSNLSLDALSSLPNAPSLTTLKRRSTREDWPQQRKLFRNQVDTKISEDTAAQQAIATTRKLVDEVELLTRHMALARGMQSISVKRLKALQEHPEELSVRDLIAMVQLSTQIERLCLDLATERISIDVNVDVTSLSDDELERLVSGESLN